MTSNSQPNWAVVTVVAVIVISSLAIIISAVIRALQKKENATEAAKSAIFTIVVVITGLSWIIFESRHTIQPFVEEVTPVNQSAESAKVGSADESVRMITSRNSARES